VILVEPSSSAVTLPWLSTDATSESELDHMKSSAVVVMVFPSSSRAVATITTVSSTPCRVT
jgi:hypothetical protein